MKQLYKSHHPNLVKSNHRQETKDFKINGINSESKESLLRFVDKSVGKEEIRMLEISSLLNYIKKN